MAQGHHQIVTKPRLYTSYPLFLYASGGLNRVRNYIEGVENLTDDQLYKLIILDPSDQVEIEMPATNNWLGWRILPDSFTYDYENDPNLVFNTDNSYAMLLGHNLNSAETSTWITSWNELNDATLTGENALTIGSETIQNYTNDDSVPSYDGWSCWKISEQPSIESKWIGLRLKKQDLTNDIPVKIGSLMFGKYFDLPQNCELNTKVDFEYGNKTKKSISGKTISSSHWNKPDNWITEPFGLGSENVDNPFRRNGRRKWAINFTSLLPKYVTSQNMMLNSNGYVAQDNHSTGADGESSLYNAYNGVDFYTNCVKMTMGGHLPMVMCIDQNDKSPSNWAIVRMDKFQVTQKTPNLYNFKISLTEQI